MRDSDYGRDMKEKDVRREERGGGGAGREGERERAWFKKMEIRNER